MSGDYQGFLFENTPDMKPTRPADDLSGQLYKNAKTVLEMVRIAPESTAAELFEEMADAIQRVNLKDVGEVRRCLAYLEQRKRIEKAADRVCRIVGTITSTWRLRAKDGGKCTAQ